MFLKTSVKIIKNSLVVEYDLFKLTKEELIRVLQKNKHLKNQLMNLLDASQDKDISWVITSIYNYPTSFLKLLEEIKNEKI